MTLRSRRLPVYLLLFSLSPSLAFAKAAGDQLLLDKGARASALAGALSASSEPGPFEFVYNPAALAVQAMPAFGFDHNEWGQGMRGEYLSAVFPLGTGALAGAVDYFSYGSLETADKSGRVGGETISPYWLGFQSGYGWRVRPDLALGARLILFQESIGSFSDQGAGLSLGASWKSPWKGLGLGLTAQNLGVTSSGYSLPGRSALGCSWSDAFVDRLTLYLESGWAWVDPGAELALAAEYQALSWLDLRLGYRRALSLPDPVNPGFTAGIGVQWQTWQLGYAIIPMGDFGWVHRLSLEYTFQPVEKKLTGPANPEQSQPSAKSALPPPVKKTGDLSQQLAGVVKKRFDMGMKYYQTGDYKAAIHEWKMVLDIAPQHAATLEAIDKAEKEWKTLVEKYRQKAREAQTRRDLVAEIQNWKNALALFPEDQESRQGLGKSLERAPAVAQTFYNAGLDDYSKGHYREAIRNWEKVLILNPEHHKAAENIQKTKEKLIQLE